MTADGRIPPSPYELGVQALEAGRFGDALHAFEQAYHLNPHDPALHEAIGRLYFEQANYRRAREYLQYALHVSPLLTGPRYLLALVELREGHADQAVALLRRVLELDPGHEAARQTLEEERTRSRVAQRLPAWQPQRSWRAPLQLCPPRQVAPDGREHPAPLRAPHHCANCFFRAGRERARMEAVRYNWWNLGLVGMLFGGWPVYLLWTHVTRDRRFTYEPLYCPVCSSNRRVLGWAFWVLVCLVPVFGFTALVVVANVGAYGAGLTQYVTAAIPGALCLVCLVLAALARLKDIEQRGIRLRVGQADTAVFQFESAEYEAGFRQLNRAFVVAEPGGDPEQPTPDSPADGQGGPAADGPPG